MPVGLTMGLGFFRAPSVPRRDLAQQRCVCFKGQQTQEGPFSGEWTDHPFALAREQKPRLAGSNGLG